MAAPYNATRSKLSRAICAYLISAGCGSVADVLPYESTTEKTYPNTTVKATISKPDPDFTGNRRIPVHISIKGSASLLNGETDLQQPRIQFDGRVMQTMDALMQTADNQTLLATAALITAAGRAMAIDASNGANAAQAQFAADNADMADFTCINWFEAGEGEGEADGDGCSWEEVLMFEAIACSSALS